MFLVAISVIVRSVCLAPADLPDKLLRYECQSWTWHPRRAGAGAVAAGGLETQALCDRGSSRAKASA